MRRPMNRPKSSAPEPEIVRPTKRTRAEDNHESLLSPKRQKKPTQVPETADDITYMRTEPRSRPKAKPKPKNKSVPADLSKIIDLTLDDELLGEGGSEEAAGERSWTPSEEGGRHLEHADEMLTDREERMKSKRMRTKQRKRERKLAAEKEKEGMSEAELRAAAAAEEQQMKAKQEQRAVRATEREEQRKRNANSAIVSTAIVFTIPEAIAALAHPDPPNSVRYDVQVGEFLYYPATHSYHLGAMGRYGVDGIAQNASRSPSDADGRPNRNRHEPRQHAAYGKGSLSLEY
jgi:hypothetical protein